MFEKRKVKKAEEQHKAAWRSQHDELVAVQWSATLQQGFPSSDIILNDREDVFATVSNTSLVEDLRGKGTYRRHTLGVPIPVGPIGGHSVCYRAGASKGHYVKGALHPEAIDRGKLVVTNQRVVFVGTNKTIECLFSKLVGANIDSGNLFLSVANREKVTRVYYGSNLDGWMQLRLALAMSIGRGDAADFAAQIQAQLNELEAKKPARV